MRVAQFVGVALVSALIAASDHAHGATIMASTSATEWDTEPINDLLDDLTLTLSGLPTSPSSDLSVTFRLRADLDASFENVTLSIDGFTFGVWLDDNLLNDSITDSVNDSGGPFSNQSATIFTGTAVIPLAAFAPLIADGTLNAFFDFSSQVHDVADPPLNNFESPEFAEFEISYESAQASVIPEPSSLTLLGFGAVGVVVGAIRRRRHKRP